ncbi:hypothetical protein HJC23_001514 [Cyclotella cryptica]|uniref:RING-type domain-containing protein n=1 Tax=Cyclotella cryptica TaxID=29204 RepID=A0ABD3P6D5_9STRA
MIRLRSKFKINHGTNTLAASPAITRPQTTQSHPPNNVSTTLSAPSHRATSFHETEVPMANMNTGTASRYHGWGQSSSHSQSLHHHQQQRGDAIVRTATASITAGQYREREMAQRPATSVRHSGHDSSSRRADNGRASTDNRNISRRDDDRHRDNRDLSRETSSGNRHYTENSCRDSRSYHYQRDYRDHSTGNRHRQEYASRDSRSYNARSGFYSRDRGYHSSNNSSWSSRDRNSKNYSYSSRDRDSNHRRDADYGRREDGRSHHHSSREREAEYVPKTERHHSSRERDSTIHQDSRRSHHPNHYHDSENDSKRPRTDLRPKIDHLKAERDAHRLEAQKTEAKLRKAQAEREIMEQNLKLEEAKRQLEIVRSQSVSNERGERASGVDGGGGASLPIIPALASVTPRSTGLNTAASDANLTATSVAAAAPSFNNTETSDADSANNDPSFQPESFDVEDSSDDFLVGVSPSRPKASGNTTKAPKSKPKKKSPAKKKPSRNPKKCSNTKKKSKPVAEDSAVSIYTEFDMMSMYSPTIVDHSLVTSKFLVQWDKNDGSTETPCTLWMSFENFLFPNIANDYIDENVNDEENTELAAYKNCFPGVIDINEFDEEEPDLLEMDFCCFVCKCSDKDGTRSARNCLHARKYHRLCCHGLRVTDNLDDFACAAGQALMEALEAPQDGDGSDSEREGEVLEMSRAKNRKMKEKQNVVRLLSPRDQPAHEMGGAVVLSINTGIGGVAVALKQVNFGTKRIIHVEADLVAQHVIRFHHDLNYGSMEMDDGIEHIVGLYNTLDDVRADPEDLVRRFGPIDLIICSSSGKTKQEHETFADRFFTLCDDVKRYNEGIHQHDSLFYMIETLPKDHADRNKYSYCTCDSRVDNDCKRTLICNWPLEPGISTLRGIGSSQGKKDVAGLEAALGFPTRYATSSVTALFEVLKTALTVGFVQKKWSDEVHPKYWGFLGMGPSRYTFKVNRNTDADSLMDMLQLFIKESVSSKHLCDIDYAEQLLKESMSVRFLVGMLQPLGQHFEKKQNDGGDSPDDDMNPHDAIEAVAENEHIMFNDGSQEYTGVEADLCVVCEDAKKKIMILPCKHMCLCEKCADFNKIKDCPMCRTKVEGSTDVYW